METSKLLESLQGSLGTTLPAVLGAVLVLVFGWIVALVVRAGARKALRSLGVDRRIQSSTGRATRVESAIASGAYYLILVLALVGFFNVLELERVSTSLQSLVDQVLAYAPQLVGAGVLLLAAWVLATVLRSLATRALGATRLDEKLSAEAGMRPVSESLGNVLYWLVILLFLPAVLGALEMRGLLAPVEGMVNEILAMLPNVLAAGVIGAVGWFVARILRDLVTNLLAATGADRMGEQAGLRGTMTLSRLVGLVVYVFVFVPALIAALNALRIEAISAPATEMLSAFMAAIPNVFGAGLILAVAWLVSGFIANLAASLLGGVGFDALPEKLGLARAFQGRITPSQLVGRLIVFFVMLFATVEAADRLGFAQVSELGATLIAFGGQVLLGVVIIGVGFWLSNLAYDAVRRVDGANVGVVASITRFAILGVVIAMGLRAMGLADDIVNLAFALTLGSVAVAIALAFGLGGREAAGRQMEYWLARLRGEAAVEAALRHHAAAGSLGTPPAPAAPSR
jgi:hypothetical protein